MEGVCKSQGVIGTGPKFQIKMIFLAHKLFYLIIAVLSPHGNPIRFTLKSSEADSVFARNMSDDKRELPGKMSRINSVCLAGPIIDCLPEKICRSSLQNVTESSDKPITNRYIIAERIAGTI